MTDVDEPRLRTAWRRAVGGDDGIDAVLARYREPHRQYHTLRHLTAVLRHVETLLPVTASVRDPDTVRVAALLHDVVYDPQSSTNEADSAALGARLLAAAGWPGARIERVSELVLATATHDAPPGDGDAAVLLDADLAVLGAPTAVYDAYVRGVRAEYAHVDDGAWRTGRAQVLRRFLASDAIYRTRVGNEQWEARARANLTAELAALSPPSPP